jgi:hypothetical protein
MIGALSYNGELGLRLTGLNELSFSCRNRDAQRTSIWFWGREMVKNAPVNYAMRFSGPVTTSPPAASGMVSDPTSSASPFARYKDALVPRRFSNNSLASFCSLPLSHLSHLPAPPPRASGRAELHLLPVPGPTETDTTRPVGKMSQRDGWLSFARRLGSIVSSTV